VRAPGLLLLVRYRPVPNRPLDLDQLNLKLLQPVALLITFIGQDS
jgi:hypothetical protein